MGRSILLFCLLVGCAHAVDEGDPPAKGGVEMVPSHASEKVTSDASDTGSTPEDTGTEEDTAVEIDSGDPDTDTLDIDSGEIDTGTAPVDTGTVTPTCLSPYCKTDCSPGYLSCYVTCATKPGYKGCTHFGGVCTCL